MIKYGLKIWSTDKRLFEKAVDLFKQGKVDFGEIYIVPNSFELKDLEPLKLMPFFVHSPHYTHNFNLLEIRDEQVKLFKEQIIKTADFLNSDFIITHPGVGDSKQAFKKNSAMVFDKRIIIETMPKIGFDGVICFGHSEEQLKFINQECGFNFCFDFAHLVASAASQKLKYKDFIKSLIDSFHPIYFHISGGCQQSEDDEHLNVFDGDFDMKWFKKILERLAEAKDIYLVFETPKQGKDLDNDIKNIEYFKGIH